MSTKLTATYNQKSKQYHRYIIDTDEDAVIAGKICVRKDQEIPKDVMIRLRVKAINR